MCQGTTGRNKHVNARKPLDQVVVVRARLHAVGNSLRAGFALLTPSLLLTPSRTGQHRSHKNIEKGKSGFEKMLLCVSSVLH
jgi:hypothetical protein